MLPTCRSRPEGDYENVRGVGAAVGDDLASAGIDGEHALLPERHTRFVDTSIRVPHLGDRSTPEQQIEFEKPNMNESVLSMSVISTSSGTDSDMRLTSSSPPKPAPRTTTFLHNRTLQVALPRLPDAQSVPRRGAAEEFQLARVSTRDNHRVSEARRLPSPGRESYRRREDVTGGSSRPITVGR